MSIEIERKFLLTSVPAQSDLELHRAEVLDIEQIYLKVGEGVEERIRRTAHATDIVFHHTYLTAQRPGVRGIDEREITRVEYEKLRLSGDPERRTIVKQRWRFLFREQLFELDVIVAPASRACVILELQLDTEDQLVTLPGFVGVEREVTGESAYSNADIARG